MTQREKTLACVMGGALLLVGGFIAARSLVWGPFNKLAADTRDAEIERTNLEKYILAESKWSDQWKRAGARTLHRDPKHALQMFREDIHGLLKRHRLTGKVPINPAQPSFNRKTEWTELSMRINVTGTVKQIVDMLRDCYRRPYFTQIQTLSIDAGEGKLKKGKSSKPVTLNMKIATLVLPEKVEGVTLEPIGDLAAIPDKFDETRLAQAPSEYDQIAEINMYQWPPVTKPPPRTVPTEIVKRTETPKPEPKPVPNRRRDADKMKVIACVSLDGAPLVYVHNEKRLSDPPSEYRVDDDIKGEGVVILIRPDGMVVRESDQSKRSGGRTTETDYFYPIGETFKQREKISRTTHPEVYAEIQQLVSSR